MKLRILIALMAGTLAVRGAELNEAHVTQLIHDVKLLGGRSAARPASMNDAVRQGDAVRTGQDSRAELTFADLTITRLGANTVFSFNETKREVNLDSGALLLSIPRDAAAARINSAAATAAISGGTALFESNKGYPTKFLVMEGVGSFCSTQKPNDCVDVPAGEMVTMVDGKINKPAKFNVGVVYHTAKLLTDFPPLPNADLIQLIIDAGGDNPPPSPGKDPTGIDDIDQHNSGSQVNTPPHSNPKFGPPSTISSPDPYVIDSSTQIQTDPTITTNGQTDLGKIYRDQAHDGPVPQFLYGSATPFDAQVFDTGSDSGPYAVFKFAHLQLAGDPTISTTNGGAINLALVSVGDITPVKTEATLTFAGVDRLFIGTQDGSITFDSGIEFNGPTRLDIYARGASSDLFMGSAATAANHIHLSAEHDIIVGTELTTSSLRARAGHDFSIGKALITAPDIDIRAGNNITVYAETIAENTEGGGSIMVDAGNVLTIHDIGFGDGGVYSRDSLTAHGGTVNLDGAGGGATFDFSQSSFVTITAGTGGINASTLDFLGNNLTLQSDGDISIGSAVIAISKAVSGGNSGSLLTGSITAAGSITASGDIETAELTSGRDITSSSGHLFAIDIFAGNPKDQKSFASLNAASDITADGGSITATGNITAGGVLAVNQVPVGTFGNIHAGGSISAAGGIFTPGDPATVSAVGSINAPGVLTGTLQAGLGITIDNTAGDFSYGIIANNISAGETLHMINSPTITPNNRSASGGVGFTPVDFTLTAGAIVSEGDQIPILMADGDNASQDTDIGNPGNGGKVTVHITNAGLTIGQNTASQPAAPSGTSFDLTAIEANGGNFDAVVGGTIPSVSTGTLGGNGGEIHITTAGDFDLTLGGSVSATTGQIPDDGPAFAGNGGTVTVDSPGQITVNGVIQVSSAEPTSTIAPTRRSASGGDVALTSTKSSGVAINVGSSGQLLAMLSNAAPGPGGKITILASGASSSVDINNQVQADRGTVDIRQTGSDGVINLANNANDAVNIRGDIVKIGALGMNGTLNIGAGTISADTILKLYAGGSNGTINFNSSVTLDGNSTKTIAANTVNIFGSTTVVTIGGKNPADVYTTHANYTGSGGNGTQLGTFGGAGANAPQPLASAPPFDTGSRPPRTH